MLRTKFLSYQNILLKNKFHLSELTLKFRISYRMFKFFDTIFITLLIYCNASSANEVEAESEGRFWGAYTKTTCTSCSEIIAKLDEIIRQNANLDTFTTNIIALLNLQNVDIADVIVTLNLVQQTVDASTTDLENSVTEMITIMNTIPIDVTNDQDTTNDNDNVAIQDSGTDNDNYVDNDQSQDNDEFDGDDYYIYIG